jgi:hypothetical protein
MPPDSLASLLLFLAAMVRREGKKRKLSRHLAGDSMVAANASLG